jgi:uncharacterized membrane protein YkoI
MKRFGIAALAASGLLMADQGEKKVQLKDLPAAVQATAKEQSRGATVRGYTKEIENGKPEYEVETVINGMTKDIALDENGSVLEVEQQIELASLPAAAKAGLEKQAGQGKILKIESVTRGSNLSYEAVVMRGRKRSEVAITSDGKPAKED